MAKTTGRTTADTRDAAGWSGRRWRLPGDIAAIRRILSQTLVICLALSASTVAAGKPGMKSRYRSAFQGQSPTGGNAGGETRTGGVLGFFGGATSDRSDDEQKLLDEVPTERLTPQAKQRIAQVVDSPTLYRQLPTQTIRCDEELFLFLTRNPEAIIGIWDLMGITNVQTERLGPYRLDAVDGSGTTCKIDLLYGDRNLHVFVADGMYDGKFAQKPIRGKGVFVFKSTYENDADGATKVIGTLDCYVKFESLGADILARSLGGLIGKSADHNFVETAKFISQISLASQTNPDAMLEMVDRMPQAGASTKLEFGRVIMGAAHRHLAMRARASKLIGGDATGMSR